MFSLKLIAVKSCLWQKQKHALCAELSEFPQKGLSIPGEPWPRECRRTSGTPGLRGTMAAAPLTP